MKRIKDPVHGYIPVPDKYVDNIIDNRHFQRLRRLKQLSATYMVYPSANHTRFEHSIGVFYLARQAFESLRKDDAFTEIEDVDRIERTLLTAALLHDIGHPPFSHIGEELLDRAKLRERLEDLEFAERLDDAGIRSGLNPDAPLENKAEHELLSCVVILEEFHDELKEQLDVDPYEVCCYVLGLSLKAEEEDSWQHRISADVLSSAMDVDRLDYITRDNYMTGADVSNVDIDRLVNSYTTCEESLAFDDTALSTISNYLEGRIAVYMWVTQHHKSVYANALLREILFELNDEMNEPLFSLKKILQQRIGDAYVMQKIREEAAANPDSRLAKLYDRFESRTLTNSCWKHRLAYQNHINRSAQARLFERIDTNTAGFKQTLEEILGIDDSDDLWVEMSYVPNY